MAQIIARLHPIVYYIWRFLNDYLPLIEVIRAIAGMAYFGAASAVENTTKR